MKPSSFILASLLVLPILSGCAVEAPTDEPASITGAILNNAESDSRADASPCDAACNNYVDQCLTLVPGATQQIFNDGLVSCLQECAAWEGEKISCIRDATNCTSMTDDCDL